MEPITRIEKLYDAIARGGTIDFEPVTREEMFLYAILRNGGGGGGDGGGGGGISVTGATVGQTVKIAEVDETGVPIAWEPVDFPSGGGDEAWEEIVNYTVPETVADLTIDKDINGNPFELKRWLVLTVWHPVEGVTTHDRVQIGFKPGCYWGHGLYETQKAPSATEIASSSMALCTVVAGQQVVEYNEKSLNQTSAALELSSNAITGVNRLTNLQGDFLNPGQQGNATCIRFSGITTTAVHAGSVIKMWGVRA